MKKLINFVACLLVLTVFFEGMIPISGQAEQVNLKKGLMVTELTTEYSKNPLGIDDMHPRLSWIMESNEQAQNQSAYQVEVATTEEKLNQGQEDIWDTGKVLSDHSVNIPYSGSTLQSKTRYYWKVRVWDKNGQPTDWSETAWWEMGILNAKEWKALWISDRRKTPASSTPPPSPYIRNEFTIQKVIKKARLYSTALGLYEPYINGYRVGKDLFSPGWTDYKKRIQYQTYDVTNQLKQGKNAIGAIVGDGWYSGQIAHLPRGYYGSQPYLFMQLEVTYEDGTSEIIATDNSWKAGYGPIISQDMLMGETYDARLEVPGWNQPEFKELNWNPVKVKPANEGTGKLVAEAEPPIQMMEEIKPVKITEPKPGVFIFDLGQNMVGNVRLQLKGTPGQKITIRHGEVLN
jgi:alpha-L-rhamnosidase